MAGRAPEERIARPVCRQAWRSLTFLHWSFDPPVARTLYRVPYRWADMAVTEGDTVRYRSRRRLAPRVGHDVTVSVGPACAQPDALDDWLTGRWRAYTRVAGRLCTVATEHPPWPLSQVTVVALDETLLAAAGLRAPEGPARAQYSAGVEARLGRPRPA